LTTKHDDDWLRTAEPLRMTLLVWIIAVTMAVF